MWFPVDPVRGAMGRVGGGRPKFLAAVLSDYESARNSGDVGAVMAFHAEDAVVESHPLDGDGIANGVGEIRSLEAQR
jgi:hypothetical protein